MKICIDTNVYSQFKAGNVTVIELLEQADEIFVPAVVIGELYAGFYLGSHTEKNRAELDAFLSRPGIFIADITKNIADRYGELIRILKTQGKPIPTNDVWISAVVFETGSKLASFDGHFQHVPGLLTIPLTVH